MSELSSLPLQASVPWAPRDAIAPVVSRDEDGYTVRSNGSPGCYGGWDLVYPLPRTPWVCIRMTARMVGLPRRTDSIHAALVWDGQHPAPAFWEPILPVSAEGDTVTYEVRTQNPATATGLRLKLLMAWSPEGEIRWSPPVVTESEAPPARRWRLGAAGGPLPHTDYSVAKNTEAYLGMCRQAAAENVDLLCLPEVMLTTGLPSSEKDLPEQAIRIPGPEIEPFQEFARESRIALCFSAWERNGDLVHNTCMLIDKDGQLAGKYRKVHLASPLEVWWGVTPGDEFPVYQVHDARVAMNICMDSSALESARVPARRGAEILCMPIMGDHRAVSGWEGLPSDFDLDRWVAIQRVRAMDNQLWMVISRNSGYGSGIFSPRGEVLALSGGAPLVHALVDLEDIPRNWLWGTFRGVGWWERREPAYGPLVNGVPEE